MPKYILHYFGVNGRAVIARALLTYAKADWENNYVGEKEWFKIKKSGIYEFEQVPVLEVDGKKYCESHAINIYLAETFNLMGKDPEENYQIVNLLMAFDDIIEPIFSCLFCKDEAKKSELKKKVEEKMKFFFGQIEKRYVNSGKKKYFLGEKFTLADIVIGAGFPSFWDVLSLKESPFKEVAPNLFELIKRLKEKELKEFYEKFYIKIFIETDKK